MVSRVTAPEHSFTERQGAGRYRYRLRACNDAGCSGYSRPAVVTAR